jgi:hypothetical protein
VSSRQEEKEKRRQERLAREQAEARSAARRKRMQLVFGALLAAMALAGVVLAVSLAGGDEDSAAEGPADSGELPNLPPQALSDLDEAADAAGCEVIQPKYEGAGHETKDFKPSDFQTNPPTSGTHFPEWYDDGVYEPGTVPNLGMLVHTLEHGRINVQYKPGTPEGTVRELEAILAESNDGYHMLLYENTTDMPYAVAATAWTHLLGCDEYNDKTVDAIRAFRTRYIDKGPESVP